MGQSFWILVFDGYGCGLDMIAPRLFELYDREKVNRHNSFSYETEADIVAFTKKHADELGEFYRVIK